MNRSDGMYEVRAVGSEEYWHSHGYVQVSNSKISSEGVASKDVSWSIPRDIQMP